VVLTILFALGLGSVCLFLLALSPFCRGVGSRRAPDLTLEGLLELRVGMNEQQVIALVGPPLEKMAPWKGGQDDIGSWVYAEPGLMETGLELSLGMESGRLVRAGAAIHDLGVYWCTEEECPKVRNRKSLSCLEQGASRRDVTGDVGSRQRLPMSESTLVMARTRSSNL
jgi:hypothetical protein